jgi:O-antigen/teichoic acid export membrane protein
MSTTKRIAKNFSWLFIGNSLNGVIVFLIMAYIASVLGAAAFGWYNFAQAFLVYLLLVADSGLSLLGTREIARDRTGAAAISLNILLVRLLITIVVFLLALLVVINLPIALEMRLLLAATFLFVFYQALNIDWVFQGLEQMEYIPAAKIIFSLLVSALVLMTVKGPADLIKAPLISASCGVAVSLLILWFFHKRIMGLRLDQIDVSLWKNYFWRSLPLAASIIMIQIYCNMDTILLGFMDKPAVVGYYSAAYKVYFILFGLFAIWQSTALPVMNKRMKDDPDQALVFVNKYARLTMLAFIPLGITVFLLAPLIINLVFGQEYAAAGAVLQILVCMFISVPMGSNYAGMWLIPAGRFNEFFLLAGVGAAVNFVLNILLIPKYSMYGAASASVIAEISAMLTAVYLTQRIRRLNLFRYYLLPLGLSAAALSAYALFYVISGAWPPWLRTGSAGAVFLATYLILALLFEKEFIFGFVREISGKNRDEQ